MKNNNKLYLFDVDGVLFDTKKNMEKSWQDVCKKFSLKIKFQEYFKNIGIPFYEILKKLNISNNQSNIKSYYEKRSIKYQKLIRIYPGVKSTLDKIRKNSLIGIVTSKDYRRTKKLIKEYDLKFSIIVCPSKNFRGKPYPDTLIYAINQLGVLRKNALYVGDTFNDYAAAKRAKIKFIYAKYGYSFKKIPNAHKRINNFDQLSTN